MKNSIPLSLALALFSMTLGTATYAQTALTADKVNVIFVERADQSKDSGKELPPLNQKTQSDAKAEIESNASLKQILESQNVELNNVVGIETAADGGKIVYVK